VKRLDIGQKIKEARLLKGLTQEELGKIVGLQKSAIAKYENGRVVNIKRSTLQKLALALDLRGSDLIIENDPKEAATLHAKVLLDTELMLSIEQYYTLDDDKKKMVRDLIRTLAE
jgi:repressor LexA